MTGSRPGPAPRTRRTSSEWHRQTQAWLTWLSTDTAPPTIRLRRYQIAQLAERFRRRSPWDVTPDELAEWFAEHPQWSRETARSALASIRSFYGWAYASGRTTTDPSRLLRRITAGPAKPRPASEDVIAGALSDATPRVYLMLCLAARHGLRRGEISRVHTDDLLRGLDGWSLIVRGKGAKQRIVPVLDDVAAAIREQTPGWCFPNGKGGHLTEGHVGVLIGRALPRGTTPHMLRHRFGSRAYQATGDIRAVQELLGHATVRTTQIYTQVAPGAHRAAVAAASRIG